MNAWRELLLAGAKPDIKDKWDRTAIQVAELSGFDTSTLWNVQSKIPVDIIKEKVTAVLTHPMCIKHFTCPPSATNSPQAPPENIRRLTVLLDKVSYQLKLRVWGGVWEFVTDSDSEPRREREAYLPRGQE